VESAKERVATVLQPIVTALRTSLAAAPAEAPVPSTTPTPTNPAQSREAGSRLVALLSELDPGAADFLQANHAALRALFDDGAWREFETNVQGYAFADAQSQLEHALERFSIA
jgi:hypothetical protein